MPRPEPRLTDGLACVAFALAAAWAAAGAAWQQAPSAPPAPYWCPMHPDVRGRAGDRCSVCGMALVPAPAPDYEPYLLDFETLPRVVRPGEKVRVRFFVREPHTGAVVHVFDTVHERVFHLFVVSRDLEYFAHVHPTLGRGGALDVELRVPRAGAYQLIADFLPSGGPPQLVQKSLVTAGFAGSLSDVPTLTLDAADKAVEGTRVKLTMPEAIAGREQLVTFDVEDAETGAPISDLEPFLGATGHLLVASADLASVFHSHPVAELGRAGGPTVVFQVLFPRAGQYRMWVQCQRRGRVVTASFTVAVNAR